MVRQLHDSMMARITDNGAVSEEFAVTNGERHGCVLAPTPFSLMFPSMLMDAERDERPGIHLAYGTTGHLLNLRRMHFRSRVSTVIIHKLLFSDKHLGIHIATRNWDEEWNTKVRARPYNLPAPSPTSGSLDSLLTPGPGLPAKSFHRQPHLSEDDTKAAFYHCRRLVQQRLREMLNERTARKAMEIQGHRHRPPAPWKTNTNLDLPFSLHETIRTVHQISSVKAPTSDSAPAEVYKHDGPKFMEHLTALFEEMRRQEEVPQNFKGATIIYLYKRIGNRQVCDNYRGIFLLDIAGKIFAHILLDRQNNHLDQGLLSNSQCGFGSYRGPMDRIFAARQFQEKCLEMRTHLYSNFVDLTKAFDTVNREGLWRIMQKFSCPEPLIEKGRQLYDGMIARVTDNGAVSEVFAVTNGVKHGCVLAPTLFSLMFSAMLMDAYRDD
ncbi:hypothetical protein SprV_1002868400 [Sparganum proliferum]